MRVQEFPESLKRVIRRLDAHFLGQSEFPRTLLSADLLTNLLGIIEMRQFDNLRSPAALEIHQILVCWICPAEIENLETFPACRPDRLPKKQMIGAHVESARIGCGEFSGYAILELEIDQSCDGPALMFRNQKIHPSGGRVDIPNRFEEFVWLGGKLQAPSSQQIKSKEVFEVLLMNR